jgi:glycosyltransferase involved in cell wall biosynthesis
LNAEKLSHSDVTVCVPAFNEALVIREVLTGLRTTIPEAEIILVDDGSTDNTAEIARQVDGVIVISHARNIGYGASLKTAMRRASGKIVAWFDGDGQHRAEDLITVLGPALSGERDAVIGVRGEGSHVQVDRVPGKLLLKVVAELIAGEAIPDLNSGLRCFRTAIIRRYLHLLPDRFAASTVTTLMMIKRGYRLGYAPIVVGKRITRSSVRILHDGLSTLHLILSIFVLFAAFRFFSLMSACMIIPALLYGGVIAMHVGHGFPVLAGTLVISGVLTFLIGLVCDQITALRKERFEDERGTECPGGP